MSQWTMVPLGEALIERQDQPNADEILQGNCKIVSKISFDSGTIHFRHDPETKTGMILIRPGDLVVSGINAYKGAVALYEGDNNACATIHYGSYEVRPDKADKRFLWWLLRSRRFQELLAEHVPGGIKTELKAKRLLPIPVPLPPVSEQRYLVERIEALAARIADAKSLRSITVREATTLIDASRRRLIGKEPQPDWVPLSSVVEQIENGWSPACEARPVTDGEWGVLKVGAVSYGTFDPTQNKALPLGLEPRPEYQVGSGDFIMSRANTFELVGACAVVCHSPPRLMLSDKLFRFIFHKTAKVDTAYLDHVLKSPALRKQIVKGATGTSPTMKNISKEKVLRLLIPRHTLAIQRDIAARLSEITTQVEAATCLQNETSKELDAMLSAILNLAFRGQLL